MSRYEYAYCPCCNARSTSRYRVDVSEQKVHTHCPKCKEELTIIHGDEKVKCFKGYK